jgi:eukaryotic-like serine/threonine-protein kinase
MPFTPGTRLGSFEILALIGSGGMGEVFRARDTKLNRDVAVKVLPDQFAVDPDRLARFRREAQILAALNHPNIGQIYGIEESGGVPAIVMELVDGETLDARLKTRVPPDGARGVSRALPLDEALSVARQIVDALGAAHEQGIIHRDLKPANIKVRDDGTVKVLDFGLAKLADPVGGAGPHTGSAALSLSPTMTSPAMTQMGVILGTAAYMSPEQAKGRPADKRSDIWAFGCVLYEMLTGHRAFDGEDVSDVLAAILRADPDWSRMPADAPLPLRRLVEGCLEKNRQARIGDIAVANFLLKEASAPPSASPQPATAGGASRRRLWTAVVGSAAAAAAVTALAIWAGNRTAAPDRTVSRFIVPPPPGTAFGQSVGSPPMSLSPDGRHLAFVTTEAAAGSTLWIRSFDTVEPRRLPGTRGAATSFWSPDGQFLAFFAEGKLKKVDAAGRSVQVLCDAAGGLGGTWNRQGTIVCAAGTESTLFRVSAAGGGQPAPLTKLDAARGERSHRWPQFLPDGRRFVYVSLATKSGTSLMMGSLDATGVTHLGESDSKAFVSAEGFLVFARGGTIFARPFDVRRGEPTGDAALVAQGLRMNPSTSAGAFTISDAGVLAFRTADVPLGEVWWYERAGKPISRLGDAKAYLQLNLSPDGKQVAAQVGQGGATEIWLLDAVRGVPSKFNDGAGPAWSPDGRSLAYFAQRQRNEIRHRGLGSDTEESFAPGLTGIVEDWSMDGRHILYLDAGDVWALPVDGGKPVRVTSTPVAEDEPQFSPDGRWIAYMSPESGSAEIYVQPFPGPGERKRVSTNGGVQPKWKRDGRELYYLLPNGTLMAVEMTVGTTIEPGIPRPLFQTRLTPSAIADQYAVAADGQRFLVLTPVGDAPETPITVVFNWTAALKN